MHAGGRLAEVNGARALLPLDELSLDILMHDGGEKRLIGNTLLQGTGFETGEIPFRETRGDLLDSGYWTTPLSDLQALSSRFPDP